MVIHNHLFCVVVTVSVPTTTSFSEADGTTQVCVMLTGISAIPIGVTVATMDGKALDHNYVN